MLPDLSVLIALILGLLPFEGPVENPMMAAVGTAASLAVSVWMIRSSGRRAILAARSGEILLAEAGRRWTTVWAVAGWVLVLLVFNWGALVATYVPRILWLIRFAVLYAPAVLLFFVAWQARGQVDRAVFESQGLDVPPSLRHPVKSAARRNGIALMPILLFIGVLEGLWVVGELGVTPLKEASRWIEAMPLLSLAVVMGIVVVTLPFVPWVFAKILRTRPLPEGPLRTALEQGAARIHLRYREIVLWPTNGTIINAMVVGFTPGTRRIFLTDKIIQDLPEDELMAVFFHEAGHAKHHHLPLLLMLFFSVALLFHVAAEPLAAIGIPYGFVVALHLAVLWYGILGWVSRKLERDADLYGAENASILEPDAPPVEMPGLSRPLPRGAALMVRALDRVRRISGRGSSHRHGTIDQRIAYVIGYATEPAVRESWTKTRRGLLLGTLALSAIAGFAAFRTYPTELARAKADMAFADASAAYERAFGMMYKDEDGDPKPLWEQASTGFIQAAAYLEGHDDLSSRAQRVTSLWNAGDTAMHGLRDAERARPQFEAARALLGEDEFGYAGLYLRFQADIELGRIAAWTGQSEAEARQHLRSAEANPLVRGGEDEEPEADKRRYYGERRRLLAATINARLGGEAGAAMAISELRGLTTSASEKDAWIELRADAQFELDRLRRLREGDGEGD